MARQALLSLLDSPLNKAGLLQVYIESRKKVLIEVNPHIRIPRTYKRFAGLMGAARRGCVGCMLAGTHFVRHSPTAAQAQDSGIQWLGDAAQGHQEPGYAALAAQVPKDWCVRAGGSSGVLHWRADALHVARRHVRDREPHRPTGFGQGTATDRAIGVHLWRARARAGGRGLGACGSGSAASCALTTWPPRASQVEESVALSSYPVCDRLLACYLRRLPDALHARAAECVQGD